MIKDNSDIVSRNIGAVDCRGEESTDSVIPVIVAIVLLMLRIAQGDVKNE
jgi:hypothetical protein